MSEIKKLSNFINGNFVTPLKNKYIENINPHNGEVISLIPESTSEDMNNAVIAAKNALLSEEWHYNMISAKKRSLLLTKIANELENRLELFAQAESLDTGKPITRSRTIDIPRAIDNFRYFAQVGANYAADSHSSDLGGFNYTLRRPVGVVGLITPWNLPLYLLTWKIAPAIMMGNTIVAKPRYFISYIIYYVLYEIYINNININSNINYHFFKI